MIKAAFQLPMSSPNCRGRPPCLPVKAITGDYPYSFYFIPGHFRQVSISKTVIDSLKE